MAITFVEFKTNYMMPGGGQAATGENVGLDSVLATSLIASGVAAAGSAPGVPSPPATQRVKFVANVMVNNSPPLYVAGDIATFLAAVSAGLIQAGVAVSN
jgi:hypothetical protein